MHKGGTIGLVEIRGETAKMAILIFTPRGRDDDEEDPASF
jgi:hypothetical protein